jgi:hypothetical protein
MLIEQDFVRLPWTGKVWALTYAVDVHAVLQRVLWHPRYGSGCLAGRVGARGRRHLPYAVSWMPSGRCGVALPCRKGRI